jgi:hypothetical protein
LRCDAAPWAADALKRDTGGLTAQGLTEKGVDADRRDRDQSDHDDVLRHALPGLTMERTILTAVFHDGSSLNKLQMEPLNGPVDRPATQSTGLDLLAS